MSSIKIVHRPVTEVIGRPARSSVFALGLALALGGLLPQEASASVSFTLTQSNTNAIGPDGGNYGTVTLTQIASGKVGIDFAINPTRTGDLFQDIGFNSATPLSASDITSKPTGWSVDLNQNEDGFGKFDVTVGDGGTFRTNSVHIEVTHTGLTIGDLQTNSTGNAAEGNVFFAAHLIPGSDPTVQTGYVGSGVQATPEPSTIAAAISGLFPLGLMAARRRRSPGRKASA